MIKYLGSKRLLIPHIVNVVRSFEGVRTVADFFSGTSRVGHALKKNGYRVLANDHLAYAHALATCYVETDVDDVAGPAVRLISEFNALRGRPGYFTETFCEASKFFQPKNGARVDAIREAISRKNLPSNLEAVMLVSLMEAADRVDSTTGVQMAYLKSWAPRARNDLFLRLPELVRRPRHGQCRAHRLEAIEAASTLRADVAYIDPPYNQHSYLGNYHIWESLVLWDKPEHYGVACKRVDCRTRKSDFNSRTRAVEIFEQFLSKVQCQFLIVSFNDEGYIGREEMKRILERRGEVHVLEFSYKRYVGAQIGIHNPRGKRVGKVGHLRNKEHLYVVTPTGCEWSADMAMEDGGGQREMFESAAAANGHRPQRDREVAQARLLR